MPAEGQSNTVHQDILVEVVVLEIMYHPLEIKCWWRCHKQHSNMPPYLMNCCRM